MIETSLLVKCWAVERYHFDAEAGLRADMDECGESVFIADDSGNEDIDSGILVMQGA